MAKDKNISGTKKTPRGKFYSPVNDPNYARKVVGNKPYDLYKIVNSKREAQTAASEIKRSGGLSMVKSVKVQNCPVKQYQWFVYKGYKH